MCLYMRSRSDFLIKVGMDVWQVQNLGRAKFFQKSNNPFKVGPQNLMIEQVFMNFRVQKSELFCKYATFCSLFYQILHSFLSKLVKNTLAKFTSQLNLMLGQNLTPEKPDVRLSVPTFIRDSPSPLPIHVT